MPAPSHENALYSRIRSLPTVATSLGIALIGGIWLIAWFFLRPPEIGFDRYFVLIALHLLACALPITTTRERRLTFTASITFAGALVAGPWTAGLISLLAYAIDVRLSRRPSWIQELRLGATHALATVPLLFFGNRIPPWTEPALRSNLLSMLAAVLFFAVYAAPIYRSTPGRKDAWAAVASEAAAFVAGLPFVALLVYMGKQNIAVGALVFAASIVAAVAAIRPGAELRLLRKQVRAMEELGQMAIDVQNEGRLLAHLQAAARDVIQFDHLSIWITDPHDERLNLRVVSPEEPMRAALEPYDGVDKNSPMLIYADSVSMGEGLVGRVAVRRRGLVIASEDDPRRENDVDAALTASMDSLLVVPLLTATRTVGVALFGHRVADKYTGDDLRLLQSVASVVAASMENARLHQSLRAVAVTDGLTGLINHRRLQEVLAEELWRSQRYGRHVSVIMCDVDFFKIYNDTYGHPQGDELLKRMARVLEGSVRATDTVARYGGEEFCILLPETDRFAAQKFAERLRKAIHGTPFPGRPGGETVRKTMSFGVASYPGDTSDPERLIALADEALYLAKRSGKNQVQLARR